MSDYTYEMDKPASLKRSKEAAEADKLINQEYMRKIRDMMKSFPCFSADKDLICYSNKLWRTIREEHRKFSDDQLLENLERAIKKSFNFLSKGNTLPFSAYLYVLKLMRVVLDEDKKDEIDEGDVF